MTKYQFIKSKLEIIEQLYNLWDNYPLYKFVNDAQWIRKRELQISECLIDREEFIEICRINYKLKEIEKSKPKK